MYLSETIILAIIANLVGTIFTIYFARELKKAYTGKMHLLSRRDRLWFYAGALASCVPYLVACYYAFWLTNAISLVYYLAVCRFSPYFRSLIGYACFGGHGNLNAWGVPKAMLRFRS